MINVRAKLLMITECIILFAVDAGSSQALQVASNYRELEKKYGVLTSIMSSQNQFIARLEKQCQCKDSSQSSLVGNKLQFACSKCNLFLTQELIVCYFCVGLDRWRLSQHKAILMCILITALKPTKWPTTFKGTRALLQFGRKKQPTPSPPPQPMLRQTLLL